MRSIGIALCAALLASCGGGELTEILVVVDTDLAVPMGIDAVRVEVSGAETMSAQGSLGSVGELPRTVGVVHAGGSLGPLEVRVVGSVMGMDVVSARASTSFIRGKTLVLPMFLSRRCVSVACGGTQTCTEGSCVSAEVDPTTLEEWNGMVPRPDGGACVAGTERCNGADDDCDGRVDEDFDLATDPANCGACANVCTRPNATAACAAGTCTVGSCASGFDDCNGDPSDGCEADLSSSASCGRCGNACTFANATGACSGGACTLGACAGGFDDCNADPSDGCETPLTTLDDCGACGASCVVTGGTGTCASGSCAVDACDAGLGDCNGDPSDGCEATLDTLSDCGACGMMCDVANGSASCASGSCAVGACDASFDDCNTDASDGCETPLTTLADCGACGARCSVRNGTATCATGSCAIDTCSTSFDDCNGDPTDGCETDLRTNMDCGRCGNACTGGRRCRSGTCR